MVEELLNKLSSPGQGEFDYEGNHVEYKITDNSVYVKITNETKQDKEVENMVNDFKKYVDNIPDELWETVCGLFPKASGITLNEASREFDKCTNKEKVQKYISDFKSCVKIVVEDEIEKLKRLI